MVRTRAKTSTAKKPVIRKATPAYDADQLLDYLKAHAKKSGDKAFDTGEYLRIPTSHAVRGGALVKEVVYNLIVAILNVAPACQLHYRDLKSALMQILGQHRGIKDTKESDSEWCSGRADRILTVLAHLRRIKGDAVKYNQCVGSMHEGDVAKLDELLGMVEAVEPTTPPSTPFGSVQSPGLAVLLRPNTTTPSSPSGSMQSPALLQRPNTLRKRSGSSLDLILQKKFAQDKAISTPTPATQPELVPEDDSTAPRTPERSRTSPLQGLLSRHSPGMALALSMAAVTSPVPAMKKLTNEIVKDNAATNPKPKRGTGAGKDEKSTAKNAGKNKPGPEAAKSVGKNKAKVTDKKPPHFALESSRSQYMCRTGMKGPGQSYAIPFGPTRACKTQEAARVAAQKWLQAERKKQGL